MSGASSGAFLGHYMGHFLGIIWGMSGASYGACLGNHLGHVWACQGQHLGHIVNNGQQFAVLHASVMPFLDIIYYNITIAQVA